jgi:hypothetical protein
MMTDNLKERLFDLSIHSVSTTPTDAINRISSLENALIEISEVAGVSEGVEWYKMIADRALEGQ